MVRMPVIGDSRRSILVCTLLLLTVVAWPATAEPDGKPGESSQSAAAFIDRFIGEWIGEGTFNGTPIHDRFECRRALDGTFLSIDHRSLDDASYEGHIYLGYDSDEHQYELYSFNNFTGFGDSLPVRVMSGQRSGDVLVTEERPGQKRLRYTFEFLDADTFRFTKAWASGKNEQPFVIQVFRRQTSD